MEDMRTASRLISRGCYGATIDLKDAYYLLSVDEHYRKYLRFRFHGILYEFNCLCFGLSSAPYTFTKLMKPIIQNLRSEGIICVNYLDDFLILGNSEKECFKNVSKACELLKSLGFIINGEKSSLKPETKFKFLGFFFNTLELSIELPIEKRVRIRQKISYLRKCKRIKIREFAQLIGTLTSACPAVKYGWLYTKKFERAKFLALSQNNENFDAFMYIGEELIPDLEWWYHNIFSSKNSMKNDQFDLEIFIDASLSGWGAYSMGKSTHGWWSGTDTLKHINYLELKAICLGLKFFGKRSFDEKILIRTDNTTALSYINKMGSVQHPELNDLARLIWQWCESKNIVIFASYIKSEDNWQADRASRILPPETEWSLNIDAFKVIERNFGTPEIDLFASANNHKCKKYVSWYRDSGAYGIDAFTLDWSTFYFYAFPPFALISRVLQKILNEKADGIIVVPLWKSQAWYPLFLKLIKHSQIILKPRSNLLSSSFSNSAHPLADHLTLVAARLSGKHL